MLFDAHTHLNFEKYTDEERRSLASEIEQSEVACLIDVADCIDSAKQALADADDYSWCYAAVGIHPDGLYLFGMAAACRCPCPTATDGESNRQ